MPKIKKREIEVETIVEETEVENDEVIGPLPSEAAPAAKKRKVLQFEKVYLENLPSAELFEKSYMHRDIITHIVATKTEFIITASCDGHIKFWKKIPGGIEFVKHFRAHLGNIQEIAANWDGSLLCSVSNDQSLKVFDIINFDLINMLKLPYTPAHCDWLHTKGDATRLVAASDETSNKIYLYDGLGTNKPLHILDKLHNAPVVCMRYSPSLNAVVSADTAGMVEYWSGSNSEYKFPENLVSFKSKLDTDLYEFVSRSTVPTSIAISHDGSKFAITAADRKIRVFKFSTGNMIKIFDETLKTVTENHQTKQVLPNMEFGRRMAVERDLEKVMQFKYSNIVFDDSGNFIIYPTLLGIKIVNIVTNRCVRVLGKSEALRPLAVALYQGVPGRHQKTVTVESQAADNPALQEVECDPTIVCSAFKKNRFYCYSKRTPGEDEEREVFNEKPSKEDIIAATETSSKSNLAGTAVIHTSMGDVHVKLYANECPKTVENFVVHSRNGFYNGHVFHRVIKGFMVQTGDPTGVGTGGESIWGGEFQDEFHPDLKHDKPYTLSMANAGPNTNGSQFFLTVIPCPWLDNKHTVFGRVVRGMEVAQNISLVKTHPKTDKPYDDVSIVSITIK